MIKNNDGTYSIVEIKRSSKTPLSKGQNSAKKQVEQGNGIFEVRTNSSKLKINRGQLIKVKEYNRINKYE